MTSNTSTHAHSKPDACSVQWEQAGISAFGTASVARFWVALEQSGPWGREAVTQSHLDPEVGMGLDRLCQEAGGRLTVIRRPGAHADPHTGTPARVYLAGGLDTAPWLLEADVDDPAELGALPWADLAAGDQDAVQDVMPDFEDAAHPVLLVCTNAKRDVCCAVRGRPVALDVDAARPGRVWECSHTGGHRFAPTGVLLPYGQTLARLTADLATAALDAAAKGNLAADVLGPAYDRGRSALTPPAQAAESFVRQQIGELDLTALATSATPAADPDAWDAVVRHRDGRSWSITARRGSAGLDRPESCGKWSVRTWAWDCVAG